MTDNILEIHTVTKEFPGVRALNDISFSVKKGTIHAICGENGAGKSTLMKILAGIYPQSTYTGTILFNGQPLQFTGDSIKQAIRKGISLVHQELALVPQATVGENIYLGREPSRLGRIDWNQLHTNTIALLAKYRLDLPFDGKIADLSVGKQQMVEIAKALSEDATLLILDEPTSALTEAEVETLMTILRRLRDAGKTCLYISHKLEEIFTISDEVTVFRDGGVVGTRPTSEVSHEQIIAMMVGRHMTERFPVAAHRPSPQVLMEVRNLSAPSLKKSGILAVNDVSFSLHKGEILGISGLMGSGRSELALSLFGEYGRGRQGTILIEGKEAQNRSARESMACGLSLVPEDRKGMGLILGQSILTNISLPNLGLFASLLAINKHLEIRKCQDIADHLAVKMPSLQALVNSLSGGNQQKVVIAKWLLANPKILILDEPTRGIDVGAKYEIYKLMHALTSMGMGIIMISSELPEILGMSNRILVMCEGTSRGILDRSEASQEKIMALATGLTQ